MYSYKKIVYNNDEEDVSYEFYGPGLGPMHGPTLKFKCTPGFQADKVCRMLASALEAGKKIKTIEVKNVLNISDNHGPIR